MCLLNFTQLIIDTYLLSWAQSEGNMQEVGVGTLFFKFMKKIPNFKIYFQFKNFTAQQNKTVVNVFLI